ncbi:MAG: DUF4299 domain-containing protein [Lachnospiraceae bacterium]|nr:DUF4299 domain-containing protein [Lachnospiraceae bacterium]
MAFSLTIQSKGLFKTKSINFGELIRNCELSYGSSDAFFVLNEGEKQGETAVLYNPKRIGRGIWYDATHIADGEVVVSYNIPTTVSEIRDFVRVVKEIKRQLRNIFMYCSEEEREYTVEALEANIDRMAAFSLEKLNDFCRDNTLHTLMLSLALFPWSLPDDKRSIYMTCKNLDDFEQTIHDLQSLDVYYAKPTLYKMDNGEIHAFYTLTEDCDSVFPNKASDSLTLEQVKVDATFIRFYIFSEKRPYEGYFPYDKFVEFALEKGATPFDASTLRVPPITKEEFETFVKSL